MPPNPSDFAPSSYHNHARNSNPAAVSLLPAAKPLPLVRIGFHGDLGIANASALFFPEKSSKSHLLFQKSSAKILVENPLISVIAPKLSPKRRIIVRIFGILRLGCQSFTVITQRPASAGNLTIPGNQGTIFKLEINKSVPSAKMDPGCSVFLPDSPCDAHLFFCSEGFRRGSVALISESSIRWFFHPSSLFFR